MLKVCSTIHHNERRNSLVANLVLIVRLSDGFKSIDFRDGDNELPDWIEIEIAVEKERAELDVVELSI